jgi:hypothetical protein
MLSNQKVSAHQWKQFPESRDSLQEKTFGSYYSDRLLSRTYKELKKLNTKRSNNPVNKWENKLNSFQKKYR